MVKRIAVWPIPPEAPCPFCGEIFPTRKSVFPHFTGCKLYKKFRKANGLVGVQSLIRTKIWLPYFFPKQHAAILKRKNKRKKITAPIPSQQPREK